MEYNYKVKLAGNIKTTILFDFTFDWDEENPNYEEERKQSLFANPDMDLLGKLYSLGYLSIEDGYLYIDGYRITSREESIRVVENALVEYINSGPNNTGHIWVDAEFSIDVNGYVICTKSQKVDNQIERWCIKIFG